MTPHIMILPLAVDPETANLPGAYAPHDPHMQWVMAAGTPIAHLHVQRYCRRLSKKIYLISGCLNYLSLLREPLSFRAFVVIKYRFLARRHEDTKQHEEPGYIYFKIKRKI